MKAAPSLNEYATAEHALRYLARADTIPHRTEDEGVLLELVPRNVARILDLGTADGRLLALLRLDRRESEASALDFSPTMLDAARERFEAPTRSGSSSTTSSCLGFADVDCHWKWLELALSGGARRR